MTVLSERARMGTRAHHHLRPVRFMPAAALVTDVLVIASAAGLADLFRERLEIFPNPYTSQSELGVAAVFIAVGWIAMIGLADGYDRIVFGSGSDEYKRVLRASFITAAAAGITCYLLKFPLSRGYFLLAFAIGIPALLLGRAALRQGLHSARRRHHLQVRVVMCGSPQQVDEIGAVLRDRPWLGYSVVGAAVPEDAADRSPETPGGVPVLGDAGDVADLALAAEADLIFVTGGCTTGRELRELIWELEGEGVGVVVAPSLTDIAQERVSVHPIDGLPLIHVSHPTWADASRWGKRSFDIVGSLALILALAPMFLFVAARIWLADRGPILFSHNRIGRDGESFGCYKFRTMVVDADAMIADLQEQTGQSAMFFKMKDDPRITRPGKWLRRYSVDELPQLFNVLKGDMSLVGPRPQVQAEVDLYEDGMERRLLVRPGMTGLWQVSGRNDLSIAEAQRLDIFYVDNWSMMKDLGILFRTVGAVFGSSGAY
ncbi:sugar transferase [Nocardioides sp. YIM 152588]|uniref:sugar transferase n=1 Tax=Nocardioides sp. YIM 152588 TaxID=3158259 RepID=UPI0032E47ECF